MHARILITGIVQGVGFRPFIYRIATENRLNGFVRNREDACVEIIVEGKKDYVKHFVESIRSRAPPLARIDDIKIEYSEDEGEHIDFKIYKSFSEKTISGSVIPPDVAICDECVKELWQEGNRRHNYFFITCTDCGPRFTTIRKLPYDRPNTMMTEFPMCNSCREEYTNPSDRRFHAQTIACPACGPKAFLTTKTGEILETPKPIREAGRLIEEGYIVAVKGNGGFHIAASTLDSKPIHRLRAVKHRAEKPFAIMAKSLETARTFAEISKYEEKLLTSYIRPIILLKKSRGYYLADEISPNLHNVGVMLPYTGMHYMLFDKVEEPAFVMTSANPPSEPIIIENGEAIRRLESDVDYLLLHNRAISQRCDDSVVRFHRETASIIRRSRGYAPTPIHLSGNFEKCVLGLGAEENVTGCIITRDKAFITQYIGDVDRLETLNFLRESIEHLLKLTNVKIEKIACDLHPKFVTTKLASDISKELACETVQVQHHHAHIASLIGEHNLDEIIGIACDGFGYGQDGKAWGGEIIYCDRKNFRRLGHLQEQPMVGGDRATKYPLRIVAGILNGYKGFNEWFLNRSQQLPYGENEAKLILSQLENKRFIYTTSCGRILDAISTLLDICYERTYEGEPAIKVEAWAGKGRDILELEPVIEGSTLNTSYLLSQLFENRSRYSKADLACSGEEYLAKGLTQIAIREADKLRIKVIGFSGGVSYNEHITLTIKSLIEKTGIKFLAHNQIPAGDGGISFGQAVAAAG